MKFTKREIVGIFLIFIVGLFSLGSWQSFFIAVMTSGVSDIWEPIGWFAVLGTFFFLGAIVWKNIFMRISGAALIFLPGLLFIRSWEYIVVGVLSVICIYWSSASIAAEETERTRFRFYKSVRTGSFSFIVGLSLLLASGYYVSLKEASWEELVPRFRIGEEMTSGIFKIAGTVNSSFAKLSEGDATVDEFLLSLGQSENGDTSVARTMTNKQNILDAYPEVGQLLNGRGIEFSPGMDPSAAAEEMFLSEGRKQIASLVGREVAGSEKISDVLSNAVQNKLVMLLSGEKATRHIPSQAIPFFLSLLLFLTLLSFASIIVVLCVLGAQLLFLFSIWVGWLSLGKVMVEQEKLVE